MEINSHGYFFLILLIMIYHLSGHANITSFTSQDMVSIIFSQVPFYGKVANVSFRISIYNDSRIQIAYVSILPKQTFTKWISGIRVPKYDTHANLTTIQSKSGLSYWQNKIVGLYPAKANVKSNTQYTACPIASVWGALPMSVDISPPNSILVNLIPLSYSCEELLDVVLYFSPSDSLSSGSPTLAPCKYQATSSSSTLPSLQCNLSTIFTTLTTGNQQGLVAWRVKGSGTAYSEMYISPIPMVFYTTMTPTSVCSLNHAAPSGCIANNICNGNFTCLNLPCNKRAPKVPVLYKNDVCISPTVAKADNNTCSIDLAYNYGTKICCTIEEQDCMGVCFGKSLVALSGAGKS